jgi:hypothetical protein
MNGSIDPASAPPHDDADQRQSDRDGNQQPMRSVHGGEFRPQCDTAKADRAQYRSQRQSGKQFAAHHAPPSGQRHLTYRSFRLEHLPGGALTHWKTPPFHGAQPKPT